ncbi:MAG: hypothetical protein HYV32_00935 [Candidatus Kerfeldbacteria bacterium]|nr:hypothetical protein [Candidatus Kerfeldbacteria bacterium]
MNKRSLFTTISAGLLTFALLVLPHNSFALTAELVSITPEPQQDISDMMTGAPDGVSVFAWLTETDTEYTAVFSVDEEPAVIITPGGDIAPDNRWSYDEEGGTVTVPFTATGLKQTSDGPDNAAIVALVAAVEPGEDGPPEEMTGCWLSTNVQDWELIPPSEDNVAFGFSLTGPEGETGFFHMFMPDSMVDFMSEMSGEELTVEDLAVFNGDNQSSMSITPVDGGAMIDINVKFLSTAISATSEDDDGSITKEITVREQLPISLAANKTELKNGKQAQLFGWLKNGKKNKRVEIWRKKDGESAFTKWKNVRTKKNGKFTHTFIPRNTAIYKVKYRSDGSTMTSENQTITVENA